MATDVATTETLVDPSCAELLAKFRTELGAAVVGAEIQRHEIIVRVTREAWIPAVTALKRKLGMTYFCFLSGMDWLDNPTQTTRYENIWGSVEDEPVEDEGGDAPADAPVEAGDAAPIATEAPGDAAPIATEAPGDVATEAPVVAGYRTGVAGGESRFQVMARFVSPTAHRGLTLKADLDDADPRVPTISGIFAGADWHERETWEMFGFWFDGHPNLIHIYLPFGFEGYPLRKDFPLLAREVKPWPGLTNVEPISGENEAEASEA